MRNTIINEICNVAENNPNIMLIIADLGYSSVEKFAEKFPDQFINTGIAEQNAMGIAAGLALAGKKIFIYSIIPFITMRCFEQIRVDVCYQNLDITIIGVGGGFAYGTLGVTHYGLEDISIMRTLPNMKIFCPSDPLEAKYIFQKVLNLGGPSYIRINRGGENNIYNKENNQSIIKGSQIIHVLGNKEDEIAVLVCGNILEEAKKAIDILLESNIKISLYSCPFVKPINKDELLKELKNKTLIFTVEENTIIGGFGSAIAEFITEENLSLRLIRMGIKDEYCKFIGRQDYMRDINNLSCDKIKENINKYIY
jgi:transketolase